MDEIYPIKTEKFSEICEGSFFVIFLDEFCGILCIKMNNKDSKNARAGTTRHSRVVTIPKDKLVVPTDL